MKRETHYFEALYSKFRSLLIFASLIAATGTSNAASHYYTFDGIFTDFVTNNSSVAFADLGVVLGETPVAYTFEIDFNRATSSTSNSAGTWYYFYANLQGNSVVSELLSGISQTQHTGFDVYYNSAADLGQINGGSTLRISSRSSDTDNWRVEDWIVGQTFSFSDGTVPAIGGPAVYLNGNVTLTSITVPEPSTVIMVGLSLAGVFLASSVRGLPLKHSR